MTFPPSSMSREKFSRRQSRDLQTSMALALARVLEDGRWPGPEGLGEVGFARVFEEWPTTSDRFTPPAACVLPSGDFRYSDAYPTPRLLEDTWEPRGSLGLGLYALSEAEMDFEVEVRCVDKEERSAIVSGLEVSFVAQGVLNGAQDARYGVVRAMPEYWGLPVRLSLQGKRLEDSTEAATKNRWEVVFLVRAQAAQVRLDVVSPFTCRITEVFT